MLATCSHRQAFCVLGGGYKDVRVEEMRVSGLAAGSHCDVDRA